MLLWRNAKCYKEKSYHYQIYHCLKVKPSFHEKLFQKEKTVIVMDLWPATFTSFVVQCAAKIASRWPQLKPLDEMSQEIYSQRKNELSWKSGCRKYLSEWYPILAVPLPLYFAFFTNPIPPFSSWVMYFSNGL